MRGLRRDGEGDGRGGGGDKKPILKADLIEDPNRLTLAIRLKAEITPTLICFVGDKEVASLVPDWIKTPDDFRRELKEIIARPTLVPAVAAV